MNPTEKHEGSQHILYDADQMNDVELRLFDAEALARDGLIRGSAQGRGTTHFVEIASQECVLRHYRRGGMVARLLGDRYWRSTLPNTRAWREWHLLADLTTQGLPVPQPIAARVVTQGAFYRADLIMRRLTNTHSLSQAVQAACLPETQWRAIGQSIRRFHDAGVFHADLNAHNILLNKILPENMPMQEETVPQALVAVWLIDFDKGEIRPVARNWQMANLMRLKRSLDKLSGLHAPFHFQDADWQQLMAGWEREKI
ncbi:MAG: 3-deoxy-D-manno-octulosonic acid kinase [Ectothiorhodospiraceae bacterium]|nr:3-deoxy-D-manno-octulosonic acid kinase [Ectothiorhodospiraceae bacterium]